ncbi:hypothetical protein ACLBWT_19025 [Paenibacillus sp. D51F]
MKTRTGWEDVDALFERAEKLGDELEQIQREAADILYPHEKKPATHGYQLKSA